MRKVLIVTEEWAGSGHYIAALALKEALEERGTTQQVSLIGGLATASPILRSLSRQTYYHSLRQYPELWDCVYNVAKPSAYPRAWQRPLAHLLGKRLLERVIEPDKPDVVISTHAYCLPALAVAKERASKPFVFIGVLTDFHIHSFWLHPSLDYYVVAHPDLTDQLCKEGGASPERFVSFGIPLRSAYQQGPTRSKREGKRQLGLPENGFTVLICGGADGHGDLTGIVERLMQMTSPLNVIVLTGNNRSLYQGLQTKFGSINSRHTLNIRPYEHEMWKWLEAADAVITKAGGLTCSEALAMRTPLILYQPLPGQERKNSRFLAEKNVAYWAKSIEDITMILEQWMTNTSTWEAMVQQAAAFATPDAATRIVDWMETLQHAGRSEKVETICGFSDV